MKKGIINRILDKFDKKYLTRIMAYVISSIVAFGVIFYTGYHLMAKLSPGLELLDAKIKTVTISVETDAYIMRNEEPLVSKGGVSGSVVQTVRDGERVSLNGRVADIYSKASPDIEKRISEIEEQIDFLRKNEMDNHSVQSSAGLDSRIYEKVFDIRKSCMSGDYSDVLAMRTDLLLELTKRLILTGQITDYSSQIEALEKEKNELRAQLGACLESVYAEKTGYFFSDYDGYGSIFSVDKIDSMSYNDFISLTESEPEELSAFCVGALVDDYRWYIACEMSKSDAAHIAELDRCEVTFSYSGETLTMDVYRAISQSPGKRAVIIFRCEKMPADFDYTRMQPVSIAQRTYEGFEIPIEAVRVVGGYEGVYILDEVTVEFRRISIVYEDNGIVLCTGNHGDDGAAEEDEIYPWIQLNDVVIVGGHDLYTGKIID